MQVPNISIILIGAIQQHSNIELHVNQITAFFWYIFMNSE